MPEKLSSPDFENIAWDAVIIGAGPAGAASAAILAKKGWRILVVEKSTWPREKACGGCLNAAGISLLRDARLEKAIESAAPLQRMDIHSKARKLSFDLPPGIVIDRQTFDANLLNIALQHGATFLSESYARLQPEQSAASIRHMQIQTPDTSLSIRTRLILACDGLGRTGTGFLAEEPWAALHTAPRARLGFALTLPAQTISLHPGILTMCLGTGGYVGIIRRADGQLHIGAALSPAACNAAHGPLPVIDRILKDCGFPASLLAGHPPEIVGTGPLTRSRLIVGHGRILALGDAAGYVEPFTGEGISWALRAATHAAALLPEKPKNIPDNIGDLWHAHFTQHLLPKQFWCKKLRPIISRPALTGMALRAAKMFPQSTRKLAYLISAGDLTPLAIK